MEASKNCVLLITFCFWPNHINCQVHCTSMEPWTLVSNSRQTDWPMKVRSTQSQPPWWPQVWNNQMCTALKHGAVNPAFRTHCCSLTCPWISLNHLESYIYVSGHLKFHRQKYAFCEVYPLFSPQSIANQFHCVGRVINIWQQHLRRS